MNLERLRAVQSEEREADSLRALPDSFYREVAGYIEELREQRASAAETAEDPFGSEEVRRLTDEIGTAEEVAEAIYERRVGKLVKRASLAAAGMPADEEGLTREEAALFSDLVAQIEAHRDEVLATFDGERGAGGDGSVTASSEGATDSLADEASGGDPDDGGDATVDVRDAMGGAADESPPPDGASTAESPPQSPDEPAPEERVPQGPSSEAPSSEDDEHRDPGSRGGASGEDEAGESTDGGKAAGDTERVTLRITRDVGEVFGVDERVYDLASEDVVTLPAANARPLLDRDAAERLE